MIIPDVNLLLYASARGTRHHEMARDWWRATMTSREDVGLAPVVVTGFLRLVTSSRVLDSPMGVAQAIRVVNTWLEQPVARVLTSDARHLEIVLSLIDQVGVAGNLTTDAHIAAHALQHGATVATHDADFRRFSGLKTSYPLS